MKTTQQIFDLVMEYGYYGQHTFMCYALHSAYSEFLITEQEYHRARNEIRELLAGLYTTLSALIYFKHHELFTSFNDTYPQVYNQWEQFKAHHQSKVLEDQIIRNKD